MSSPQELEIVERLKTAIGADSVLEAKFPRPRRLFVTVPKQSLQSAARYLKESEGFSHLSTVTGLDNGKDLEVIYHLNRVDVELSLRTKASYDDPTLPTTTGIIPGSVLYEREVHDLVGVSFEGHPDLSPLVLPDGWPATLHPLRKNMTIEQIRSSYPGPAASPPQESPEENTFLVPFGPQHPALKEPESFTFKVDGETVVEVKPRIGYNHRGVEKALENQTWIQNQILIERVCGICSCSHTQCYTQGVEELLGLQIPPRIHYLRTALFELNRIHSHYLWLGVAGHEIGFDTLFMYVWRDREIVMDILEALTGNRNTYSMNIIGGLRRDFTPEMIEKTKKAMDILEQKAKEYKKLVVAEPTLMKRVAHVGVLRPRDAIDTCAVGPTMRACGIKRDVRADDPHASYGEIPFNVITYDGCDIASMTLVRLDELVESTQIVRYALSHLPDGPASVRAPRRIPQGEVVTRVEAPRGELIHYQRSNGTEKPERYKLRCPTLANVPAVVKMLTGGNVADIPIALAAIDPCFSCTDRMTFLDERTGKRWVWSEDDLKRYSRACAAGKVKNPVQMANVG